MYIGWDGSAALDRLPDGADIPAQVVAAMLVGELNRNPYATWCRARGCRHLAHQHDGEICTVPGCECEGLKL